MPRVNIRSTVADESAVIPSQEGPSSFVLGIIDDEAFPYNILGAVGFTAERESGIVRVSSVDEWHQRLKSTEATGFPFSGTGLVNEPFIIVKIIIPLAEINMQLNI